MKIELKEISRIFGRQRIFSNINYSFLPGEKYVVLGGNGSGKSTLIKIIYGALSYSGGDVIYSDENGLIKKEDAPYKISLASPYLELIEELKALEFLNFYQKFRPFSSGLNSQDLLHLSSLEKSSQKEIRNFSSGMKQRLRLILALCSDCSVVLLDEPVSNLDPEGVEWYRKVVMDFSRNKTIIIGSNYNKSEMDFCLHQLDVNEYK